MSLLQIQLLGTFQVLQNGRSLTTFRTDKIRALLAYLAVESDRTHRRESLAALLWPNMSTKKALTNLRLSLHRLCHTLGEACPILQIERHAIGFDTASTQVDVLLFDRHFSAVSHHPHSTTHLCPDCARQLETAVSHYKGDFLSGFFLKESTVFDNWAAAWREKLHQQTMQALTDLAAYHQENGRFTQAIPHIRRQLTYEPWQESAHRRLMWLYAQTGQVTAAQNQYERCHFLLRDELGIEPNAETTALYEQIRQRRHLTEKSDTSFWGPFSPDPVKAYLPSMASPFMGRQAELAQLEQLITNPSVRIVTITGVGGIGKTRLAIAFAAAQAGQQAEPFPHGTFFVPLGDIKDSEQLLAAIGQALPLATDLEHDAYAKTQLHDFLRTRQLLLVLDNFEHLLDWQETAVSILRDLIHQAPQLKLIITSRERLQLQMEHVLALAGLPYPDDHNFSPTEFPAIQLFVQSVRRVQPEFKLFAEDMAHMVDICRLLDGTPLSLEMAAAWVAGMPIADVAAEIRNSLDFLAVEMKDWPERHRSMRSVIDASWDRLSLPERLLFVELSLFQGGFTRAAVQALTQGEGGQTAVLRLLTSLVSKSLLRYDRLQDRYALHEQLRQYGAEKLSQQANYPIYQQTFATYYCRWLHKQETNLLGERQKETLLRIETDLSNIRAAWSWAVQQGDFGLLTDAAFSLGTFFLRKGRYAAGLTLFDEGFSSLETIPNVESLDETRAKFGYWRAMFEPVTSVRQHYLESSLASLAETTLFDKKITAYKAAILLELGIVAYNLGQSDRAEPLLKKSLTFYRLNGSHWGEANVMYELGFRTWRNGAYAFAEQWFSHCLRLRQQIGDVIGIARAFEGLAGTAMFGGQTQNANEFLTKSYAAFAQLSDDEGMARLKIKQAQINWYHNLEGLSMFEEGLACLIEMGARRQVAVWTVLYAVLKADEDIETAVIKAQEGQQLCAALDYQRGVAISQGVLSRAALVRGDFTEALKRADDFLHRVNRLPLAIEQTDALVWMAWASFAAGHVQQAERYAVAAVRAANYWYVTGLGITAVLIANRATHHYELAWQILGFGESRFARLRGPVSQSVLARFLPEAMQNMPPAKINRLKKQGHQLTQKAIIKQVDAFFV